MSDVERRVEVRFRREDDRHNYRWARAVTRSVLSCYFASDPRELEFTESTAGKPAVETATGPPLRFSLAHTAGMTTVLLGEGREVGVDVESAQRFAMAELPLSLLGEREIAGLNRLPLAQRPVRLIEHWALKEAYAKACGRGLELPLGRCQFVIDDSHVSARLDPRLEPEPWLWSFALAPPTSGYVIAVAASLRSQGETAPELLIFSTAAA